MFRLFTFDKIWYNLPSIYWRAYIMNDLLNNNNTDSFDDETEGKYISNVDIPENANLYVKSLIDLWNSKDLQIPFFQRRFVWTIQQASLFIESLLSNLPIPALMFYRDSKEYQYIIDGQQRTKTILYFTGSLNSEDIDDDNKKFIKFRLTGLAEDSPYYNKTFAELDPSIQRKFYNRILQITTVKVQDEKDLPKIFEIFRRLNTGGTPLTKQEIRNCICAGNFNEFLIRLNENKKWQSFITSEKDRKRQRDVELILRFFALYDSYDKYKRPMDDFLTLYFQEHRNLNEIELNEKETLFNNVVNSIYDNLVKTPFHIKNGLNSGVCDSVMVAFANNLDNIPDDISNRFFELSNNAEFYKYCGKSVNDNESVKNRIQMANDYLFGIVENINLKIIRFYDFPVSAGHGNFIGDETATYTEITTDNRKADYAVKITGDSMEPDYHDGDILLVKSQNTLNSGQLGIFFYDGDTLFKKYRKNKKKISIISLNKDYKIIDIPSNRKLIIQGLVLGKISNSTKL